MGKHPDLERLVPLVEKGSDFQLTGTKYEELTGASLPKTNYYLLNNSALAKWTKEHGYEIVDIQEKPILERIMYFKKKRRE